MDGESTTGHVTARPGEPGVVELVKELRDGLATLLQLELRLARAEVEESVAETAKSGLLLVVAAVVALGSWLCVLGALVTAMHAVFAAVGLGPLASLGLSFLAAALVTAAAAIFLASRGRARLRERRLAPTRAIESVRDVVGQAEAGGGRG